MSIVLRGVVSTALASLVGCASITDGTSQTIIFNLDPSDTTCKASREGDGELGSFKGRSATLTVGKDKDDIIVSCSAPNHEPKTQRIVSKTQAAGVVGGVFIDLGITDMLTGAMWKYPSDVSVVLEPMTAATLPGSSASAPAAIAAPTAALEAVKVADVSQGRGQEMFQVTKLARELACHPEPAPQLNASGPGFESYTVKCADGDALSVRCDMGACRALR